MFSREQLLNHAVRTGRIAAHDWIANASGQEVLHTQSRIANKTAIWLVIALVARAIRSTPRAMITFHTRSGMRFCSVRWMGNSFNTVIEVEPSTDPFPIAVLRDRTEFAYAKGIVSVSRSA